MATVSEEDTVTHPAWQEISWLAATADGRNPLQTKRVDFSVTAMRIYSDRSLRGFSYCCSSNDTSLTNNSNDRHSH